MYKIAERHLAIWLQVGLNCLTVSESLLTPPPFACSKCCSSNNILNKLCSGITPYFMWGLQALAGIPWERRLKKIIKVKATAHYFLALQFVYAALWLTIPKHEGWKSTYVNYEVRKKILNFQFALRKDFTSWITFCHTIRWRKTLLQTLEKHYQWQSTFIFARLEWWCGHPCVTYTTTYYSRFWTSSTFSRREALSVKTIVSNEYFICTTSQNQHFKFLIQYFIKKAWYL